MNVLKHCKKAAAILIAAVLLAGSFPVAALAHGSVPGTQAKAMKIKASYQLPGKNKLTLDKLSIQKQAQQVTFHTTKKGLKNDIELRAADDQGTKIRFSMAKFENGKGIFENSYLVENGEPTRNWIAKDAKTLTVTVYISGLSETGAENGWKQVGEAVTLDLKKLKEQKLPKKK